MAVKLTLGALDHYSGELSETRFADYKRSRLPGLPIFKSGHFFECSIHYWMVFKLHVSLHFLCHVLEVLEGFKVWFDLAGRKPVARVQNRSPKKCGDMLLPVIRHVENETHRSGRVPGDKHRIHFFSAQNDWLTFHSDHIALRARSELASGTFILRFRFDIIPILRRHVNVRPIMRLEIRSSPIMVTMAMRDQHVLNFGGIQPQLHHSGDHGLLLLTRISRIDHDVTVGRCDNPSGY